MLFKNRAIKISLAKKNDYEDEQYDEPEYALNPVEIGAVIKDVLTTAASVYIAVRITTSVCRISETFIRSRFLN